MGTSLRPCELEVGQTGANFCELLSSLPQSHMSSSVEMLPGSSMMINNTVYATMLAMLLVGILPYTFLIVVFSLEPFFFLVVVLGTKRRRKGPTTIQKFQD